jgi:hypothetical protein
MDNPLQALHPLQYHLELRNYFKSRETELWNWFSSAQAQTNYTEALKLDLLKSTYRLDRESHADLYRWADEAQERLELSIPLTIYQSQNGGGLNAALYFIPGEGHIVLSGPLLSLLSPEEMKALIGHELAHYVLWTNHEGELLVLDHLTQAIACDPRAAGAHGQSARWLRLYTEIYADRGALVVTRDINPVICLLVKTTTGLQQVSAASYLKQAEEVFRKSRITTDEVTHPEAFIRARALALWAENVSDAAAQIATMIEGAAALDDLDILGQSRVEVLTRRFIEQLLRPKWFQTNAVLGHARMFFPDFAPATRSDDSLTDELKFTDPKLREYLCFVLLDFVAADPELEQMPLAAALQMAEMFALHGQFEKIASKELKIRAKELAKLKSEAPNLLAAAETSA